VRVVEGPRGLHAQLAQAQHALERDLDLGRALGAVLDGDGVHRAREVRVAAVRGEHRAADHEPAHRARERRQPLHRALPRDPLGRELADLAVHPQRGTQQGLAAAGEEVRAARKLDRRARAAVQHADRVDRPTRRVDARQRQPVVAGDLPRHGRGRDGAHVGRSGTGTRPARAAEARAAR
jgi:hypothetical protein